MISITGQALTLDDVQRVALGHERDLVLSPEAREKVSRSRRFVEELLQENERIYGVTTGFGRLSEVFIQPVRRKELQLNLIRSHASGVGQRLSSPEVRTMMLLRANSLARGDSGCRVEVVERRGRSVRRSRRPGRIRDRSRARSGCAPCWPTPKSGSLIATTTRECTTPTPYGACRRSTVPPAAL